MEEHSPSVDSRRTRSLCGVEEPRLDRLIDDIHHNLSGA